MAGQRKAGLDLFRVAQAAKGNDMETTESVEYGCMSRQSFARFAQFITSELGIKMPESKMTMVQGRLMRRVRDLRLDSVEQYCEYFFASSNSGEREHFINAITTNKTDFFREPAHFDYLTDTALPSLCRPHAAGQRRLVTVWSAGCSSGEEPYTLAMVLSEYAAQQPELDFAILATDISTKVLDLARRGIYQESQVAPIPPEIRTKYLLQSRDGSQPRVRITPGLRRSISFHRLNFMEENYSIKDVFDVIFFRNVMIYFDRSTQESVINRLCRHLAPGGYLFVGHSESLAGLDIPVQPVRTSILRKPLRSL
jgi:chemotaxis protein methyltransferase CheR